MRYLIETSNLDQVDAIEVVQLAHIIAKDMHELTGYKIDR